MFGLVLACKSTYKHSHKKHNSNLIKSNYNSNHTLLSTAHTMRFGAEGIFSGFKEALRVASRVKHCPNSLYSTGSGCTTFRVWGSNCSDLRFRRASMQGFNVLNPNKNPSWTVTARGNDPRRLIVAVKGFNRPLPKNTRPHCGWRKIMHHLVDRDSRHIHIHTLYPNSCSILRILGGARLPPSIIGFI